MAFLCFLLYLVVLYIRPAEWIAVFRGSHLANVTLIGTAFFVLFGFVATRKGPVKVPHNGMLLGLLGAIIASHAVHTYLGGLMSSVTAFAPVILMYFLTVNTLTTERKFRLALWMILVLTALLAVQGIHQFQTGVGWAGQWMIDGRRITWISIFNDPNDLALAFVIMVPVLLAYLVKPTFFGLKIVPLSLLGLLLYGVYLTNSRGGILGLAASVMFFFLKRSRWVIPGAIVGGVLSALLFLFGPSRLGVMAATDESSVGRLDAWYYAFQLIKSNPVFGVGQNMFTDRYPLTAHNSFVLAAAELGVVGLFCWVGLFYTSFKGLSLIEKHCSRLAPYAYGLQASLMGFAATTFFLSRTYTELPYLLCGFSAALYSIARQETDRVEFRFGMKDARNVVVLSVGALLLVQIAMKTWL